MTDRCAWQFHGISRRDNGDGTVTLEMSGWRYTSNTERIHPEGTRAACMWCAEPVTRTAFRTWETADGGDCPVSSTGTHQAEPLPATARADAPCLTRTVPAQFTTWGRQRLQLFECGPAAAMVTEHCGYPYVPVFQGRGWTVEIASGTPLWRTTG